MMMAVAFSQTYVPFRWRADNRSTCSNTCASAGYWLGLQCAVTHALP